MNRYWSNDIGNLKPYVPGEQPTDRDIIKLNTNESPYPPSPKVIAALTAYNKDRLRLYPDPDATALKNAVADYYRVQPDNVFAGNGSDEVLALAFMAFFRQSLPVLFADITYSFYPVYSRLFNIDYQTVPLDVNLQVNLDGYAAENGGILIANPNAPTGVFIPLEKLVGLLRKSAGSVVLVDEAYIDFGGDTAVPLIGDYPNLLVVQTLSKSRCLAGMRVGFAIGDAGLIEGLERVKNSFNSYPLDSLAIAAAVEALRDKNYVQEICRRIIDSRQWLDSRLTALGFEVLPSRTNFLFTRHRDYSGEQLFNHLRQSNILVRHFQAPRIDPYVRITIGLQEEVEALVASLERLLQ